MSRGGAAPAFHPTAWAYIPSGHCTIRWQRGDKVAYVVSIQVGSLIFSVSGVMGGLRDAMILRCVRVGGAVA
jgi:hypothetical protein